jgi:hypothetical protein
MRLSYRNRGQIGLRATPVAKPSPMQRLRLYSACWLSRHRTPGRFVQYAAPHCAARMAHASNMWSSATRPASLDQGLAHSAPLWRTPAPQVTTRPNRPHCRVMQPTPRSTSPPTQPPSWVVLPMAKACSQGRTGSLWQTRPTEQTAPVIGKPLSVWERHPPIHFLSSLGIRRSSHSYKMCDLQISR